MIKPIITNQSENAAILGVECEHVKFISPSMGSTDAGIVQDLLDTAESVRAMCLGLSANQIGYSRRIFVFRKADGPFIPVVNPVLVGSSGGVKAMEERCLSRVNEDGALLPGINTRRPKEIRVRFYDVIKDEMTDIVVLKGPDARVFLHELDHLNGVLV